MDISARCPAGLALAAVLACFAARAEVFAGSAHDVLQLAADDGYGYPTFSSLVDAFLRGGVFLDIHTELYPSGEIRGQLISAVPEPSALGLLGVGIGVLALARRHRRGRQATG